MPDRSELNSSPYAQLVLPRITESPKKIRSGVTKIQEQCLVKGKMEKIEKSKFGVLTLAQFWTDRCQLFRILEGDEC